MKKVDLVELRPKLKDAVEKGYMVAKAKYPSMVAFGLYTSFEDICLAFSVNEKEHLEKNIKKYPEDAKYYTYGTNEWSQEGAQLCDELDDMHNEIYDYNDLDPWDATDDEIVEYTYDLIETCVLVLEELKKEGLFEKDLILMVNDAVGELDPEKEDEIINRLNG